MARPSGPIVRRTGGAAASCNVVREAACWPGASFAGEVGAWATSDLVFADTCTAASWGCLRHVAGQGPQATEDAKDNAPIERAGHVAHASWLSWVVTAKPAKIATP